MEGEMLFVLLAAHVNPRNHGYEHAVFWIIFAVVIVLIFILAYGGVRLGWFRKESKNSPEGSATTQPDDAA